jgi:two-component system chemotaxis response regulator CheY
MALKLLLVEDNEFVQRMYGRAFTTAQFDVMTANDGADAIQSALVNHPDIIIMDVMMPNMNGLDALKALKESDVTKNIPIIMLSAYDDEALMMQALNMGASRYLLKGSLEPDTIVSIVKSVATT